MLLEEFGTVIARGGVGVVIASQSGHRMGALTPEEYTALATRPADELLALPMLHPDQVMGGGVTASYFHGELAPQ